MSTLIHALKNISVALVLALGYLAQTEFVQAQCGPYVYIESKVWSTNWARIGFGELNNISDPPKVYMTEKTKKELYDNESTTRGDSSTGDNIHYLTSDSVTTDKLGYERLDKSDISCPCEDFAIIEDMQDKTYQGTYTSTHNSDGTITQLC
jgi:hypothetical protein